MPAYPLPVGRRIAYDGDGAKAYQYNTSSGVAFQYTAGQLQSWNSEPSGAMQDGNSTLFFGSRPNVTLFEYLFFPGPRDLTHIALWVCANHSPTIAFSTDAVTPGGAATWTTIAGYPRISGDSSGAATATTYRTYPVAVAGATTVKALRVSWFPVDGNDWVGRLHVYGTRSTSDTNRQVAFCDSTGARPTVDFDYGDTQAGAQVTWKSPTLFSASDQLYVKNFGVQTANSVVVSAEVSANDSGSITKLPTETTLSLDNVTYTVTETFASITPGAIVGPLFVRYSSLTNDPISLGIGRTKIAVGSWT